MRLKIVETQNAVLTGVFVINLLRQFCQNRYCDAHLARIASILSRGTRGMFIDLR